MALASFRKTGHRPDWFLGLIALGIAVFGLAMILSASAYLAGVSGDVYYFVTRQATSLVIGFLLLLVLARIDYRIWRMISRYLLPAIILILLIVLVSPAQRGVHRWITLGSFSLQPAEFVKAGFLLYLAAWLTKLGPKLRDWKDGLVPFCLLLGLIGLLVMLQPDMGTAVTILTSGLAVYFLAGLRRRHMTILGTLGVGLALVAILIAPYRLERLETFLNPSSDPLGAGYQTNQIGIAIGSGGFFGSGFGKGKLKYLGYVPEVHTDSIFAVIVEELGFLGALALLIAFFLLLMRGFAIAARAPDSFGQYLAGGITFLILLQLFVNLAAMLQILPLTGIPLPLVSYGGTSLIVTLSMIGLLLSISRFTVHES